MAICKRGKLYVGSSAKHEGMLSLLLQDVFRLADVSRIFVPYQNIITLRSNAFDMAERCSLSSFCPVVGLQTQFKAKSTSQFRFRTLAPISNLIELTVATQIRKAYSLCVLNV